MWLIICTIIGISRGSSDDYVNDNDDEDDDEDDDHDEYATSTTIYNYNSPGRTISLDCSHCGASLELDLDNLIAACPYCHHKILLDTSHLGQLFSERERTKREEEKTRREQEITEREKLKYQYELEKQRAEYAAKEREEKRKHIVLIVTLIFTFIIFFILPRIFL